MSRTFYCVVADEGGRHEIVEVAVDRFEGEFARRCREIQQTAL